MAGRYPKKISTQLKRYKSTGPKGLFFSPRLYKAAHSDKTGKTALRFAKIDALLGFRRKV